MAHIDLQQLAKIEAEQQAASPSKPLHWHSVGSTHVGRARHANEDAYFEASEQQLWAVADGMGGHNRGDYASRAVVRALESFTRKDTMPSCIEDIEARLIATNDECLTAFRGKRTGTTVVALFAFEQYCYFLWAGDSRIYRMRDQNIELMTLDHSVAQEKVTRGELSAEEAEDHPSAHKLTRAVGAHTHLHIDLRHCEAKSGDRYLICSDGLYYALSEEDILSRLSAETPALALEQLMDRALDCGGRDNITAIVVEALESS